MNLQYNGVVLKICHFEHFDQRAVFTEDNTDYLYTHYRISVVCVWNRLATASFQGQILEPPTGTPGDRPAVSLPTLRHTLMQKRQGLIVDIGGTVILSAPQKINNISADSDANNGPTPISCDVTAFHAQETAIVRYTIECAINESLAPKSVFLANRWESTEDIDETFRSTINVSGQVVFRRDLIDDLGHQADAWRNQFILPVPDGYQRTRLRVVASSDGCRVSYSFSDEQAEGGYQILPLSPVVRAQGSTWYETDWEHPDITNLVAVPVSSMGARVEVWGRQTSTRRQLANAVVRCLTSIGLQPGKRVGRNCRLEVDFPRRHAFAQMVFSANGIVAKTIDAFIGASLQEATDMNLFNEFDVAGVWESEGAPRVNIAPVNSRSDAVVALVTQALLAPDTAPTIKTAASTSW